MKKTIGVYLGSEFGVNDRFSDSVIQLGKGIAKKGYTLIYGGASIGLMGLLAKTVKKNGGKVVGVITDHLLSKEIAYEGADKLHIASSMYDRKKIIHQLSDTFVVLPGGLGTLDESFETWCQIKLGIMSKEIAFINIDGFFSPLFSFLSMCHQEGFYSDSQLLIPNLYTSTSEFLSDLNEVGNVKAITGRGWKDY